MMNSQKPFQFKFFLPNARVLAENEIASLPAEKIRSAEQGGADGLWLEINCPDGSCLDSEGRITLPTGQSQDRGILFNLFCPENSCEIVQSSDLP